MAPDKDPKRWFRIPIRFSDSDDESSSSSNRPAEMERETPDNENSGEITSPEERLASDESPDEMDIDLEEFAGEPDTAELVAARAELKRVQNENAELKNQLARRQADFENYRKRVERERTETYNRVVADVATKLLPVTDNLKRALEAEATAKAVESDEFRHFLSGVDLIHKQLNGVLDALGLKPIIAVGEVFNPHIHEAVATEPSDEFEPDTVMQEIVAGYRLGDKLIRPALVKVATRK